MTVFSDEEVMAYADGELAPARRREFRAALPHDPSLARRLEQFILTGRRLAEAFAPLVQEASPPQLVAMINGSGGMASASQPIKPFMFSRTVLRRLADKYRAPVWSIGAVPAFALALALGFAVAGGWSLLPEASLITLSESGLVAAAPLRDVLETGLSGKDHKLAGHRTVTVWPTGTYSTDKGWCRSYQLLYDGGQRKASGSACRTGTHEWRIDQQLPISRGSAPAAGSWKDPGPQRLSPAEEVRIISQWARER